MAKILTFDLGTTYFKAALFDEAGRLCGLHRQVPPIARPSKGRWELDAGRFRETIGKAVAQLRAEAGGSLADVAAISFATQTNSFILLDAADEPLAPLILWPDERAGDFEGELRKISATGDFQDTTGVPTLGPQFMVAKLLWLRREEADVWRR
ncbi:MAG: hypothetical protein KAU28_00185, partial [Phycisphaerae bacterium]|nr:hypothetical protein [Phycisphaerae bacterium]